MNKLGKIGEDTATRYLEKMKYTILKRNYRNRRGEINKRALCSKPYKKRLLRSLTN